MLSIEIASVFKDLNARCGQRRLLSRGKGRVRVPKDGRLEAQFVQGQCHGRRLRAIAIRNGDTQLLNGLARVPGRPMFPNAKQQPNLGVSFGHEDAPGEQCPWSESQHRADGSLPSRSGHLNDSQALRSGFTDGDIRMGRHEHLSDGPCRRYRCLLIGLKLCDGSDDPVGLQAVLDFIDKHDGPFADGGLLNGQGRETTSAKPCQPQWDTVIVQGDGAG